MSDQEIFEFAFARDPDEPSPLPPEPDKPALPPDEAETLAAMMWTIERAENKYGEDKAIALWHIALEEMKQMWPARTKPEGPHNSADTERLLALWAEWQREHPGKGEEGKYLFEEWCFETGQFRRLARGSLVRRLNRAMASDKY